MTRSMMAVLIGSAAIQLALPAWAATSLYVVNPNSENLAIPLRIAGGGAPTQDGSWQARDDRGRVWPADVFRGQCYLSAPVERMSARPIEFLAQRVEADALMKAATGAAGRVQVQTSAGEYIMDPAGITLQSGANRMTVDLASSGAPVLAFAGAGLAVVEWPAGKRTNRMEIYRSGIVKLTGFTSCAFNSDSAPLSFIQASAQAHGISMAPDGKELRFPDDWVRAQAAAGGLGLAFYPAQGTQLRPTNATVQLRGNTPEFYLKPAGTDLQAWAGRFQTLPAFTVQAAAAGEFAGVTEPAPGKSAAVRIVDRNSNGVPDCIGDLWLWSSSGKGTPELAMAFSKAPARDSGQRLCFFNLKTAPPDAVLVETPTPLEKGDLESVKWLGALKGDGPAFTEMRAGRPVLRPLFMAEDWNKDGEFFRGSLLSGGFLGADRASKDGQDWTAAWDLDGDDLCEVFQYGKSQYVFNFLRQFVSLFGVRIDCVAGTAQLLRSGGYDLQLYAPMFSKTCDGGNVYKEAPIAFEEHFYVNFKPADDPKLFPNGAQFFYYTIGGGDINRLTMGKLHGGGGMRAWEVELDPTPADNSTDWIVRDWKDAAGHVLHVNSISVPEKWDGRKLGPREYYSGWYTAVDKSKYPTRKLFACFSPGGMQSGSSEGMYGGSLTTPERIEVDEKGGTYTLYFSPLMNALHLKGADFGSYAIPAGMPDFWLDINRFYHREAHAGPMLRPGTEPSILNRIREAKRLEGPVFLCYSDADRDGFFDTYLYDQDNDGLYDRTLHYDAAAQLLTLNDGRFIAAWPQPVKFEEVLYVPESYNRVAELYRKGFNQPPLVVGTSLGSSGIPMTLQTMPYFREKNPDFFTVFDRDWQVAVAAYNDRPGENPWKDFTPAGLSRLGTMFVRNGLSQSTADGNLEESLKTASVLVISALSVTPADQAVAALKRWVEAGGRLVLACPPDEAARLRYNALGAAFGFSFGPELLDKRAPISKYASLGPINDPNTRAAIKRMPAPWNETGRYRDLSGADFLKGFQYLSFDGFALADLRAPLKPLLEYEGRPLLGFGRLGRGALLVCGADWFRNRLIWHHEEIEAYTQDDQFMERLVQWFTADLPVLKVSKIAVGPEKTELALSGRGGPLRFSRRYGPTATGLAKIGNEIPIPVRYELAGAQVNGRSVPIRSVGVLKEIDVPAGATQVTITYKPAPRNGARAED